MREIILIPAALTLIFLAGSPIYGQYASLSLDLKVTLYASDQGRNFYPGPREGEVGIVFVKGTPGDSYNEENLGRLFNLNKVRTAGEAEMDVRQERSLSAHSGLSNSLRTRSARTSLPKIAASRASSIRGIDSQGVPRGIVMAVRDLTEREKSEEELGRYRGHLEKMVEKRTLELDQANRRLQEEIADRIRTAGSSWPTRP